MSGGFRVARLMPKDGTASDCRDFSVPLPPLPTLWHSYCICLRNAPVGLLQKYDLWSAGLGRKDKC